MNFRLSHQERAVTIKLRNEPMRLSNLRNHKMIGTAQHTLSNREDELGAIIVGFWTMTSVFAAGAKARIAGARVIERIAIRNFLYIFVCFRAM